MTRRAYLEVSTAHLTHETAKWLDGGGAHIIGIVPYEKYGWWVYVGGNLNENTPPDLIRLINHAADCGCDWILFDCDAHIVSQFPTFDW